MAITTIEKSADSKLVKDLFRKGWSESEINHYLLLLRRLRDWRYTHDFLSSLPLDKPAIKKQKKINPNFPSRQWLDEIEAKEQLRLRVAEILSGDMYRIINLRYFEGKHKPSYERIAATINSNKGSVWRMRCKALEILAINLQN